MRRQSPWRCDYPVTYDSCCLVIARNVSNSSKKARTAEFWHQSCLQAIMEAAQLKKHGQVKHVVVTGCLAQRYSEELAGERQGS